MVLQPGKTCVDVGCGVGGPMRTIASTSGAQVTGITINDYQVKRATYHNERVSTLQAAGQHKQLPTCCVAWPSCFNSSDGHVHCVQYVSCALPPCSVLSSSVQHKPGCQPSMSWCAALLVPLASALLCSFHLPLPHVKATQRTSLCAFHHAAK